MRQKLQAVLAAGLLLGLAAACQSQPAADNEIELADAKPDPRQGERVSQICFTSTIRSWKANDRHSVIVEKGVRDEYKLELSGACDPRDAFTTIGLISRVGGGSCLTTGDKLITDARFASGSCLISRIYKWDSDANKTASNPS